jgi:hypothetical protein
MKHTKNFKRLFLTTLCFAVLLFGSTAIFTFAQSGNTEKAEVPLSNPSKPASIKVSLVMGGITVTGYNGKTIQVEAVVKSDQDGDHDHEIDHEMDDEDAKKERDKSAGMMEITNTSTGLSIIEDKNEVAIQVKSFMRPVNISLKVPFKTSLKLHTVNNGKIHVEKVEGDIEVGHTNGPITLKNVSGTVVANTVNGDLTVSLDKVNPGKPLSFSSFNGDVDVTFPDNAKFDLNMRTDQGKIFSDFKLEMKNARTQKTQGKEGGRFELRLDRAVRAALNGGGEEALFKTFNGNIYIRKKK